MSGIVVGVDGSIASREALAVAIGEAERREVALTVVWVLAPEPVTAIYSAVPTDRGIGRERVASVKAAARGMVAEVEAERGRPCSVPVYVLTFVGHPADVLAREAGRAEMLVVGSRGAGGFSRLMLGSVSSALVHHAPCPVLVVRPAPSRLGQAS